MAAKLVAPRVDPDVYHHPKTRAVAAELSIQPCEVVYHMTRLWGDVYRRKTGGLAVDMTGDVDAIIQQFGRVVDYGRPAALLRTLRSVGFLDKIGSELWVHDWLDWQGVGATRAHKPDVPVLPEIHIRSTGDTGSSPENMSGYTGSGTSPDSNSESGVTSNTGSVRSSKGSVEGIEAEYAREKNRDAERPPVLRTRNWFGQFMWWLVDGFGYRDYKRTPADTKYLTDNGEGVDIALAAECYIAIANGMWGDDFDRRALSGRHALNKAGAFYAFKRRKNAWTIVPLTPAGIANHPTARERRDRMGSDDAGSAAGGSGPIDSSSFSLGPDDVDGYTKEFDGGPGPAF